MVEAETRDRPAIVVPMDRRVMVRQLFLPFGLQLSKSALARSACVFGDRNLVVEKSELSLLLGRRCLDIGRRVSFFNRSTVLWHVVEEREQFVKLPLRKRIVLVVVAARTADRQAQPDRSGCFDAVDDVFDLKLLGDHSTFGVTAMIAIKPRRNALFERRVGKQIAGELFARELIERHPVVVGINDPVSPTPHLARSVVLVTAGIGIARGVEPDDRHPLAIGRRLQQPVNQPLVGIRRRVGEKGCDFLLIWRQASQIERDAPDERRALGFP